MVNKCFDFFRILSPTNLSNFYSFDFSKLPNSLNSKDNELQICLIVKDVDAKDRDYERTIRKYKQILENEGLSDVISRVIQQLLFQKNIKDDGK